MLLIMCRLLPPNHLIPFFNTHSAPFVTSCWNVVALWIMDVGIAKEPFSDSMLM